MALERAEIVLLARGRFDLRTTVLSHGAELLPPFRWHDGARPVLERAEELPDGSVHLLRIRSAPRGAVLEVTGEDAREIEVLAPLAARVRHALALDVDFAEFHRACARDPVLRPVARLGLGHVLRGTSVFEDVVKVLARSTNARAAARSIDRLVALGRRCPARPALRAFPSPGAFARLPAGRLREFTALGHRAVWITALARDVVAGRRDLERIARLSASEAARALRSIPGIGAAGTACLLLLLGHYDEPVRDRAARAFARRVLGNDRAALDRWLRSHTPWRGLGLWLAHRAADPAVAAVLKSSRPPEVLAKRVARRSGRGMRRSRARVRRTRPPER
jgi:3-methyladenine DNA glycosylase/8-oxoguanine DNA glycosylase